MNNELRPWEVARMIEEAGRPVEFFVWDGTATTIRIISGVHPANEYPFICTDSTCWKHARLPQKPERRKITDRYKIMKRCRELDAQGNGILVRFGHDDWWPWMCFVYSANPERYQYTHIDDDGQPTGEPQDFLEEV